MFASQGSVYTGLPRWGYTCGALHPTLLLKASHTDLACNSAMPQLSGPARAREFIRRAPIPVVNSGHRTLPCWHCTQDTLLGANGRECCI